MICNALYRFIGYVSEILYDLRTLVTRSVGSVHSFIAHVREYRGIRGGARRVMLYVASENNVYEKSMSAVLPRLSAWMVNDIR